MKVLVFLNGRKVVDVPLSSDVPDPRRTDDLRVLFMEDGGYGEDKIRAWAAAPVKE